MSLLKSQSAGGQATAKIFRKKALERYYENPNICTHCSAIIYVKEGQKIRTAKLKKFCNQSCAATYNNLKREKTTIDKKLRRAEQRKKNKVIKTKPERFTSIKHLKKVELFSRYTYYQTARAMIQKHARYVYSLSDNLKSCLSCGYDRHFEVCHIIPVSDFADNSTIIEINEINNLIALCPTHHWEFDNGYLKINKPL